MSIAGNHPSWSAPGIQRKARRIASVEGFISDLRAMGRPTAEAQALLVPLWGEQQAPTIAMNETPNAEVQAAASGRRNL